MRNRKQFSDEDEDFAPRHDSKRDSKGRDKHIDSARRAKIAMTFIGSRNVREKADVEEVKATLFKGAWIPVRLRAR